MRFDTPTADEMPLVYDYWARSYKKSPWAGCVLNKDYDTVTRNTIEEILNRGARVIVAVEDLPDGARRVIGYSVSEPARGVLHWLCIKEKFRGLGLGKALLAETLRAFGEGENDPEWTYSFRTPSSERFLRHVGGLRHDPVSARAKL